MHRAVTPMTLESARRDALALFPGIAAATRRPTLEVGGRDPLAKGFAAQIKARTPKGFPIPALLLFGLVDLLELPNLGHWEKVQWTVLFSFKEWNFGFEHQKFGLRMLCEAACYESPLVREVRGRAEALTNVAETFLANAVVPEKIRQGDFTVENLFPALSNRYWFLRGQAKLAYATPPPEPKIHDWRGGTATGFDFDKPDREGSALAAAAVDAYFSLTEHVFSLSYGFLPPEKRNLDLLVFLGSQWREKFKATLDLGSPLAKKFYDRFRGLREDWRNPLAHGGFLGSHGSLYFHLEGVGALPARLRRTPHGATVGFKMPSITFEDALRLFDDFDRFLSTGPLSLGYTWVSAGLNVAFDSRSLEKYQNAMKSESAFSELMERTIFYMDMHVNMDY